MPRGSNPAYQKLITAPSPTAVIDTSAFRTGELTTVRKIGWSIVESNLRLGLHTPDAIAGVRTLFSQLFDFESRDTIPLNLHHTVDPASFDLLGRAYEQYLQKGGNRKASGEYYSHPEIARHMVMSLELEKVPDLESRLFIDIACGSGIFLASALKEAIEVLRARGMSDIAIANRLPGRFFGLDLNPIACEIARINLFLTMLNALGPDALAAAGKLDLNVFPADAIENGAERSEAATATGIKRRSGRFRKGFDYILGNPPYLEAKRMPPYLKEQCVANFPELEGAFDLYMAFLCQCNRLVARNGQVHLILPDKFTVARYSKAMRKHLLSRMTLLGIADLSGIDAFSRASVYPILLHYRNTPPGEMQQVPTRISVGSTQDLSGSWEPALVPQAFYGEIGAMSTIFCMPRGNGLVEAFRRIFGRGAPASTYLSFRSTVTFHKKGLRERFVGKALDHRADPARIFKYLGGRSYARKNEVELLGFDWQGYYIGYDQAALAQQRNRLPPIDMFTREKIVFCQHARRIVAAYDEAGEYVCKDVYPIAIAAPGLEGSPYSLRYFAGLLNSELMSFIYNTLYKGVQISGGYYHYLPTWIEVLPVIAPARKDIMAVERIVADAIAEKKPMEKVRMVEGVDEIVYRTYGVTDEQQAIIRKTVPAWPEKY